LPINFRIPLKILFEAVVSKTMRHRKLVIIFAAVLLVLLAGSWVVGRAVAPWAQDKFIKAVGERFASTVELESLRLRIFPRIRAEGLKMVFRHHGRTDVPPLFEIYRFVANTSIPALLFGRITQVRLEGLRVTVARGRVGSYDREKGENKRSASGDDGDDLGGLDFIVEEIVADGAYLEVLSKEGKDPLIFDLFKLTLLNAGPKSAMKFTSVMTNPKPPGNIVTEGRFGPWNKREPRRTPVSGKYTFANANLSYFEGLKGILSSEGIYDGILERIVVDGWTDTPDFQMSGNPVRLKTHFHVIVDGTDGDTYLDPVEATFLQSKVIARGKVEGVPGRKGKAVILDVVVNEARVEDMVAMAVPVEGEPPLIGPIQFTTQFNLPPGDEDVVTKLELDGQFGVEESTFTSKVQGKVDALSTRAQAKPGQQLQQKAAADFEGEFHLADGTISFPRIEFQVPGANVIMSGNYTLRTREMDFKGHLLMDAKISETLTGVKAFFLKPLDPFFRDKGKTSIPIKVSGTVKDPHFGLALGGPKKAKDLAGPQTDHRDMP
jgi:hypothetical protein